MNIEKTKSDRSKKYVKAHLYKSNKLIPNDYAFEWEGYTDCFYRYGKDLKTHEVSGSFIDICDWSEFLASFAKEDINEYYPTIFWKVEDDRTTGQCELSDAIWITGALRK